MFYNHVFTRERVQVDVHWAFSEDFFPFEIDQARLWRRLSHVRILEKSVETLDVEDTVLVLCVHGARHCWGRLAWIADVAHLVSRHPDIDLLRMLDEARDRGVGRILAVGLTLAGALLEAPIPENFVEQSRSDPIVRELRTEFVERLLCGAPELAAADQWLLYLRLRERLRDRTRCCVRLCELPQSADRRLLPVAVRWYVRLAIAVTPNTRDYSWVRLPDGLGLLYWLVRPIRLALKVARGGQQG